MLHSLYIVFLLFGISSHSLHLSKYSSTKSVSLRIIGGEKIDIKRVPYYVTIENYYGYPVCGGSIISAKFILTAGHCVSSTSRLDLRVRIGSSIRRTGGTVMTIRDIIMRSDYYEEGNKSQPPRNDIAVIELYSEIVFGQTQQPIAMFNSGEQCQSGSNAQVSGFGKDGNYETQKELNSVIVPVIDIETCNLKYQNLFGGIRLGQICTLVDGSNEGTCVGDSGAPMVIDRRLAGIVSYRYKCRDYNFPSVYTEVAFHRDWINSVTGL